MSKNKIVRYQDEKQNYSSEELYLSTKHSMVFHHNKIDLKIIAKLNLELNDSLRKESIYFTNNDIAEAKIKEILKIYGYNEKQQNFTHNIFLRCSFKCNLKRTILVGEAYSNENSNIPIVPIFINDDDSGYFYDIEGNRYLPTYEIKISNVLKCSVHVFMKKEYFNNKSIIKHTKKIQENIKNGEQVSQEEILKYSGIRGQHEEQSLYRLNRIRITPQQKEAIATHLLNYSIIESLNYDETKIITHAESINNNKILNSLTEVNKADWDYNNLGNVKQYFQYHTRNKLNFFCLNKIKRLCRPWLHNLESAVFNKEFDTKFRRSLFVGFSVSTTLSFLESNAQRRAIFLLADGTFSDGYYDYLPIYKTLTINTSLKKNYGFDVDGLIKLLNIGDGKSIIQYNYNWLENKQAYLFTYWPYSLKSSLYNQYFRKTLYRNYIWQPLSTATSLSAIMFSGLYIFGAASFWPFAVGIYAVSSIAQSLFFMNKLSKKSQSLDVDKVGGKKTKKHKKKRYNKNVTNKSKI